MNEPDGISWEDLLQQARQEAALRFPPLPQRLRGKLDEIRPTERIYHPVLVTLRSGELRDAVYMSPAIPWFEMWGVWPGDDQGKSSVSLSEVTDLVESPSRLPSLLCRMRAATLSN